jgi:hypothetical protein
VNSLPELRSLDSSPALSAGSGRADSVIGEWIGIGTALVVIATVGGAFWVSWRKRKQKPPKPSQPYREWKD